MVLASAAACGGSDTLVPAAQLPLSTGHCTGDTRTIVATNPAFVAIGSLGNAGVTFTEGRNPSSFFIFTYVQSSEASGTVSNASLRNATDTSQVFLTLTPLPSGPFLYSGTTSIASWSADPTLLFDVIASGNIEIAFRAVTQGRDVRIPLGAANRTNWIPRAC